jgi:predicted ATPase
MELVERHVPLQELTAAWHSASEQGCLALIHGEAGIGKTSLVAHFAEHFVEQFGQGQTEPVRQLWGACDDLFTPRPLGPLHDIAAQTSGTLSRLLQEEIDRSLLFAACLSELQSQPTMAVIEDIHWADEATLDLLKYLGRRIQLTRSLLILTYRDDELTPQHPLRRLLGDLATSSAVRRLALSPLSLEGVRRLAQNSSLDAVTLHRLTEGNPFFVTELLATATSDVPATVREAVLARAARLSLSGRAALNAAAVIGPRINPWLLADVVRAEAEAINESLDLGLLLVQGDMLTFRHELARQAILDSIPPHQRVFLHRSVLDALQASPIGRKDVTRLAHHAAAAGDPEAILTYARAAAKEAAALGMHRAATAWFELIVPYVKELPLHEQVEFYESYGMSAQGQGLTTSLNTFRRAAELAQAAHMPVQQGLALARMATVLYRHGRHEESESLLQEALTILEPLSPNRALVTAYRQLAMQYLLRGEAESALAYAEKGHQMALRQEQIEVILDAYQVVGLCMMPFDHARGLYHLQQCLEKAIENKQFRIAGTNYSNLIMHGLDTLQTKWVEDILPVAKAYMIAHDLDINLRMAQAWEAILRFYQAFWVESESLAETVLEESPPPLARIPALIARARLLARRGEAEEARLLLDEALIQSQRCSKFCQGLCTLTIE